MSLRLELAQSFAVGRERGDELVRPPHRVDEPLTHHMVLVLLGGRTCGSCVTCSALAERDEDRVAIELFPGPFAALDELRADLACPVELAWRVYGQESARSFDQSVMRALTNARREYQGLTAARVAAREQ